MAHQYGIGLTPITDKICIGKQDVKSRMWVGEKRDISDQFLSVVMAWLPTMATRKIEGGKTNNILINLPETRKGFEDGIKALQKMLDKLPEQKNNNDEKK